MTGTAPEHRRWVVINATSAIVAILLVCTIFADFGVTWDEPYHEAYGSHLLDYYATLGSVRDALSYHNLWLYGGAFDLPVAIIKRIVPLGSYETAHLASALTGLMGAFGAARIAGLISGPRAGWIAGILLLATPSWFGHMFFNPKDIPFGAGMTWTLYYAICFLRDAPNVGRRGVVGLGVALGLTLGVRISGVFALIYIALGVAAWIAWRSRVATARSAVIDGLLLGTTRLLPALAIAYCAMVAVWPWAQQSPIIRPFQALTTFANSPWDLDVLLAGKVVNSLHLPVSYLPIYFAVKLPEFIIAFLPLGAWAMFGRISAGWRLSDWRLIAPAMMLVLAVAFPFLFFAAFRPVTYDGIRHFLFVLPPIAAVAACGIDGALSRLAPMPYFARTLRIALGGALAWQAVVMVRLHPDQYVYYNALAGGVGGAAGRYELDYWGNSYREAVERLVELVASEGRGEANSGPYRVMVCSAGTSAAYFFPPSLNLARSEYEADFYIASTRLGCDEEYDGDIIAAVRRDGATLSVVKDRRGLRASAPERLGSRLAHRAPERQHPGLPAAGGRTP
ncbi:MAG: hypothetical protein JNK67_23915 [Alphaproteobacteria bacterium]|nr:hypothetical protein [Alphaproteobacteria bacterium]